MHTRHPATFISTVLGTCTPPNRTRPHRWSSLANRKPTCGVPERNSYRYALQLATSTKRRISWPAARTTNEALCIFEVVCLLLGSCTANILVPGSRWGDIRYRAYRSYHTEGATVETATVGRANPFHCVSASSTVVSHRSGLWHRDAEESKIEMM